MPKRRRKYGKRKAKIRRANATTKKIRVWTGVRSHKRRVLKWVRA